MSDLNKVVLSTRIRLARNYKGYNFIPRITEEQAKETAEITKQAVMGSSSASEKNFRFLEGRELENEAGILTEEHLLSPGFARSGKNPAVILSENKEISILINEEDHLRIQVIKRGYDIDGALKEADLIDDLIEEKNEYAFSPEYGYLTACPTNLGTGIRASVMLHLPAITMTGRMNELIRSLNRLGFEVRGIYGEGTGGDGNIYQISNRATLGISEEEITEKLKNITSQIADQELSIREKIRSDELYDKIYRSLGILKSCYKMSYKEFLSLESYVILGADMGIISISADEMKKLYSECAPHHIAALGKEYADPAKRDIRRAELLREKVM